MMYVYDMANVKYKWKEVSIVGFPSLRTIPCLTETRPVHHLFSVFEKDAYNPAVVFSVQAFPFLKTMVGSW